LGHFNEREQSRCHATAILRRRGSRLRDFIAGDLRLPTAVCHRMPSLDTFPSLRLQMF
jgi:hypothetical protein